MWVVHLELNEADRKQNERDPEEKDVEEIEREAHGGLVAWADLNGLT